MTSRVTPAALPSEVSRHTAIQTSSGVLGLACIGMFFYGLGNILAGPNASTYPHRLSWILQCVGPLLVAIAVTLHIDHLSYRIGRSAVVLIIGGAFLQGVAVAPFVFAPTAFLQAAWFNWYYGVFGSSMVALGLGLASVALHKGKQIEGGLAQIGDVGDTDPHDVTVHASFLSLLTGSVGLILNGLGTFQQISSPEATREAWVLQVLGMLLVAVGIASHIAHLRNRIGLTPVGFAIVGSFLMGVACLPYAVDPHTYTSSTWGQTYWNVWGAGAVCGSIAVGLVIVRKRSVEADSPTS